MSQRFVEIVAPSRIHLGLLSFGSSTERQFGGAGLMIDTPATHVRVTAANELAVRGHHADRALHFARCWSESQSPAVELACVVDVLAAPPQHVGLGTGTQLGLSVATALTALYELPAASPVELALSVGRGRRSAVGTYGFAEGGFLVDGGKRSTDAISPLDYRWEIPDAWRFVLVCSAGEGISGPTEAAAFRQLPDVSARTTAALKTELRDHMIPALVQEDFAQFAESIYRYGRLAGSCFAERQGGPYNGQRLTGIVERIRALGVPGVGQSSWGPTIFALLPSEPSARCLVAQLEDELADGETRIWIAAANNRGARVVVNGESLLDEPLRTLP